MHEDEPITLLVSGATYSDLERRMDTSDTGGLVIFMDDAGRTFYGLQIGNVTFVRSDDTDSQHNSGRMSDYLIAVGEEAFAAGYEAGAHHAMVHGDTMGGASAWDRYTPSDALDEMATDL